MRHDRANNLDLFNYYAIHCLEIAGSFAPKQAEIDRVERLLKRWFMLKMKASSLKLILHKSIARQLK